MKAKENITADLIRVYEAVRDTGVWMTVKQLGAIVRIKSVRLQALKLASEEVFEAPPTHPEMFRMAPKLTRRAERFIEAIKEARPAWAAKLAEPQDRRGRPDRRQRPADQAEDRIPRGPQGPGSPPGVGESPAHAPGRGGIGTTEFVLRTGKVEAFAREEGQTFVVKTGSTARKVAGPSFAENRRRLRDDLVRRKVLVADADPDLLRFEADVPFSSRSAAAGIVTARSANGRAEWKEAGPAPTKH